MQLYKAEVPSPVVDRLRPRVTETARTLWKVYVIISAAEVALLWAGGMDLFESACHTFGTLATGGFSTRNASIGAYGAYPPVRHHRLHGPGRGQLLPALPGPPGQGRGFRQRPGVPLLPGPDRAVHPHYHHQPRLCRPVRHPGGVLPPRAVPGGLHHHHHGLRHCGFRAVAHPAPGDPAGLHVRGRLGRVHRRRGQGPAAAAPAQARPPGVEEADPPPRRVPGQAGRPGRARRGPEHHLGFHGTSTWPFSPAPLPPWRPWGWI